MAPRDGGTRVLPPGTPSVPMDEYAMCAAPALARAAMPHDMKTPFRVVTIVSAQEVCAGPAGPPQGLQTVKAIPFIGFEPGKWWGNRIPVLLGPPPGLPANSVSSVCALQYNDPQTASVGSSAVAPRSQPKNTHVAREVNPTPQGLSYLSL